MNVYLATNFCTGYMDRDSLAIKRQFGMLFGEMTHEAGFLLLCDSLLWGIIKFYLGPEFSCHIPVKWLFLSLDFIPCFWRRRICDDEDDDNYVWIPGPPIWSLQSCWKTASHLSLCKTAINCWKISWHTSAVIVVSIKISPTTCLRLMSQQIPIFWGMQLQGFSKL